MELDQSLDFDLHPEVYNPEEDSYLLLSVVDVAEGDRFLEIGSGSGLIAVHAAKAGAVVTATDINPHAIACTRRNALKNGVRVEVVESDLFEKVPGLFDTIVFNPPYLAVEESSTGWIEKSWSGGADGSEVVGPFLREAWRHLAPDGKVYTILSSLSSLRTILRTAREHYTSTMLEERRMFFESIFAYKFEPVIHGSDK